MEMAKIPIKAKAPNPMRVKVPISELEFKSSRSCSLIIVEKVRVNVFEIVESEGTNLITVEGAVAVNSQLTETLSPRLTTSTSMVDRIVSLPSKQLYDTEPVASLVKST